MTGVEVVLAALAAGAGAGSGDVAKAAMMDAYTGFRDLVKRRLGGRSIEAASPEVLRGELIAAGVDRDEQILAAAHQVLALSRNVYVQDAKGVQIGDHNTQHNTFG
ncbi:RIP homotypic interaction motif-containing protein [Actinoplanes sp. CA-142083]|uniref:RIP homotypic interaction motif-containing protein n=1 Tax=Actinoplanes sp. CA-142083 TaxID=3239903 RepID=UPI003D92C75D